jgi:hypothetical protein
MRVKVLTAASAVSSAPSTQPWLVDHASPDDVQRRSGAAAAIFFTTS